MDRHNILLGIIAVRTNSLETASPEGNWQSEAALGGIASALEWRGGLCSLHWMRSITIQHRWLIRRGSAAQFLFSGRVYHIKLIISRPRLGKVGRVLYVSIAQFKERSPSAKAKGCYCWFREIKKWKVNLYSRVMGR